jgi:hypothetical protein
MQGNTLSYLYSVEWPAFAVVAGIGWWQMFHDTPEDLVQRKAHHARMRLASAEVVARTLPRSARAITVGSEDVDGRVLMAGTAAAAQALGSGASAPAAHLAAFASTDMVPASDDTSAVLLPPGEDEDGPVDAMTDYNRYLATLAVYGKPKTWRNPRGL